MAIQSFATRSDFYSVGEFIDGFSGVRINGTGFTYAPALPMIDVPVTGTIDAVRLHEFGIQFLVIKNLPVSDVSSLSALVDDIVDAPDLDDYQLDVDLLLSVFEGADLIAVQGEFYGSEFYETNDRVFGIASDDDLLGGLGDDEIYGGGGNDFIDGGDGNDALYGGRGDDDIFGGEGDDLIYGGGGNDYIEDDDGSNEIYAEAGDDVVFTDFSSEDQFVSLGNGNDLAVTGDGDDIILGWNGNDEMDGGAGNDLIRGQSGDDTIYLSSGQDRLHGGTGADTFDLTFNGFDDFFPIIDDVFEPGRSVIFDFDPTEDLIRMSSGRLIPIEEGVDDIPFEFFPPEDDAVILPPSPPFIDSPEFFLDMFIEQSVEENYGIVWTSFFSGNQLVLRDLTFDDLTVDMFEIVPFFDDPWLPVG